MTHDVEAKVGRIEIIISNLLRAGVITSICVIVIGLSVSFAHHRAEVRDPQQLSVLTGADAQFPHSIRAVIAGLRDFRGQAIIVLGLLILIATPVARVAISILAFAVQRDTTYVIITTVVLALLILSFVLGHASG